MYVASQLACDVSWILRDAGFSLDDYLGAR